jgi:hypothetical protein
MRGLKASFVLAIAAFAWLRFSENTVDNDLWGHVLYGQRAWLRGGLEYVDTFSWTAAGRPWINHEFVAEITMGWVHHIAGGTGLWLMMIGFTAATVGLALREGRGLGGSQGWCTLSLFALSINAIATGFAMRPQLFSTLALVWLLILLRRFDHGSACWVVAIPLLFVGWVNSHGGYLAGLVVVLAASLAHVLQVALRLGLRRRWEMVTWGILSLTALAGALCNPWGWRLVQWTLGSVLLARPNIGEWHPLGFSAPGVVLMTVMMATLLAWCFSRERLRWWEAAVLIVLAAMALRSQRHTPFFCLANLMFTPLHIKSALPRLVPHCRGLVNAFARPSVQWVASGLLVCAAAYLGLQSISKPKEHPFTMEVERGVFPEAAVSFITEYRLTGNTITFFDWGQHVLWRLPHNLVSFDGRLDTVYPVSVMAAHWRLYDGKDPGVALDNSKAEVALLPVFSLGAEWLRHAGWTTVYQDGLAEVLLRQPKSFPLLAGVAWPIKATLTSTTGRAPFPSEFALLATSKAPR